VEFGAGFALADLRGSEADDPIRMDGDRVVTAANHNGGVNGGITNGMPLIVRTVVKPTPTIRTPRRTVSLASRSDAEITVHGRHDPAIAPRAAIVQTAVTALVLCDLLAEAEG
jgi:chorismate synthase